VIWAMLPMLLFLAFAGLALSLGHLWFAGAALVAALFLSPTVTVGKPS
jgi:hypothetical protein